MFHVLCEIEIGTHETVEELVCYTDSGASRISLRVPFLLPQITVSTTRKRIKLVAPSVRELGFTEPETFYEARKRGIEKYHLLPSTGEIAFQLCRQYEPRMPGEHLLMAMEGLEEDPYSRECRRLFTKFFPEHGRPKENSESIMVLQHRPTFNTTIVIERVVSHHPTDKLDLDERLVFVLPEEAT